MKTIHLTNFYHPTSGGISTFYRAMLNGADRAGHEMRLIVPAGSTFTEHFSQRGLIHFVKAPSSPVFDRRYRLLLPTSYMPPFAGEVLRLIRAEKPDLIEICDKYTLCWLAGLIRRGWIAGSGRPVLVGLSCERMDDNVGAFVTRGSIGTRFSRWYIGNIYLPLFDYHLANSVYTASELQESMRPGHRRPVSVMPMGAEIEQFSTTLSSPVARQRLIAMVGGDVKTRLLLYAGRVSAEKNIPLLIATMESLAQKTSDDFRLLVIGSGPMIEWLRAEADRRVPGRIHLAGHVSDRRELVEYYANCDLFIHANPREPFGIAPLEAMAAGIPLLAPRAGGVLSYASDDNAWLCHPNGEAFADGVISVFTDAIDRRDRLSRARWTADKFNWAAVTTRFFEEYERMIAESSTDQSTRLNLPPGRNQHLMEMAKGVM
jgi:alpha-1,6-mannosyltransferase